MSANERLTEDAMAKPASQVVGNPDISQRLNLPTSAAHPTVNAREEKKKQKSHSGAAASASESSGPGSAPTATMLTERNVQLLTATQRTGGTSHGCSVASSAEKSRRYEEARAAFEMAEARVAMLAAARDMAASSHTGSVGRHLDDVRSDTGS